MTLADALVFAGENCGAEAIVDAATLTGACIVALGTGMGGMFSPNKDIVSQLKAATAKSGKCSACEAFHKCRPSGLQHDRGKACSTPGMQQLKAAAARLGKGVSVCKSVHDSDA